MPATLRTLAPLFWSPDLGIDYGAPSLSLAQLLPKVGQPASAYFERQDYIQLGETLQLIWCPPLSDLNGWSEQPSEIAHSQLLQVQISAAQAMPEAPLHGVHQGLQRYRFQVLSCTPLLVFLQAQPLAPEAWQLARVGDQHGHSRVNWDRARGCGRAQVQGLTYLVASDGHEGYMEMLFEESEQQLVGLLSVYLSPSGNDYHLGRRVLEGDEQRAIRQALAHAEPLRDSQDAYLER
ncbi:hypothetical protein J4P02_24430 [Pseudomonas sp. NFXW11]|uniref:hypothetical protein n=1 Tax=Pseudomonas sp. NFXW11 TaxID=2819531 RepID=UPI003CF48B89